MIVACERPVLIIEGPGDKAAVPLLIRNVLEGHDIYSLNPAPHPKQNVQLKELRREGELERFLRYAAMEDADSILVAVDCNDECPKDAAVEFCKRAQALNIDRKIGFVLFRAEFETLFLFCMKQIAEQYPR